MITLKKSIIFIIFGIFGQGAVAFGSVVSQQELMEVASLVFEGSVIEAHSYHNDRGFIVTDCRLRIEKILKTDGKIKPIGNFITLLTAGGQVGKERVIIPDMPQCVLGQHGLYLIKKTSGLYSSWNYIERSKVGLQTQAAAQPYRIDAEAAVNYPVPFYAFNKAKTHHIEVFKEQLAYWNRYMDVFDYKGEVSEFGDRNGRNEFVGTLSEQQIRNFYHLTWEDLNNRQVRGHAVKRSVVGSAEYEIDIILNADKEWSIDSRDIYERGKDNISRTILHELGHVWGLAHQPRYLSVMNSLRSDAQKYSAYPLLHLDDLLPLRETLAEKIDIKVISDLAVTFFYPDTNKAGLYVNSELSRSSFKTGEVFTVSKVLLENVGYSALKPKISWYLTTTRFKTLGTFIGDASFSKLAEEDRRFISANLTIPKDLPSGTYYLVAVLEDDDVKQNNVSWLDTPIQIRGETDI